MRCAIYTRKSADERSDSVLSTLETQRELCAAYVASQAGEGWMLLPDRYDDLGYSGGTMRRPGLKRLMDDISAGLIDIVIVYKIDRLSRSVRDFLAMVDQFDAARVSFVAVTQSFSTTSSMGRLTLNVLLSFAQFERELTSERLRDWFAKARERGMWTSRPPFGYDVIESRLIPNGSQAAGVRHAFRRYPALRSALRLAHELNAMGLLNRDGRPFIDRTVANMLHNRLYRGDLVYQGSAIPGEHEPLVTEAAWNRCQQAFASSARRKGMGMHRKPPGLLQEALFGLAGRRLMHVGGYRRGKEYRYYLPTNVRYRVPDAVKDRYRARDLEDAACLAVESMTGHPINREDPYVAAGQFRRLVERADVNAREIIIQLRAGGVACRPHMAGVLRASGGGGTGGG